jgi:hypothetical protein
MIDSCGGTAGPSFENFGLGVEGLAQARDRTFEGVATTHHGLLSNSPGEQWSPQLAPVNADTASILSTLPSPALSKGRRHLSTGTPTLLSPPAGDKRVARCGSRRRTPTPALGATIRAVRDSPTSPCWHQDPWKAAASQSPPHLHPPIPQRQSANPVGEPAHSQASRLDSTVDVARKPWRPLDGDPGQTTAPVTACGHRRRGFAVLAGSIQIGRCRGVWLQRSVLDEFHPEGGRLWPEQANELRDHRGWMRRGSRQAVRRRFGPHPRGAGSQARTTTARGRSALRFQWRCREQTSMPQPAPRRCARAASSARSGQTGQVAGLEI